MAFKIAKNSLFAVLARSPWWYSVSIGLLLIAISLIVAGGHYLVLGVFSALPFLGIACFSGYKQSQRPSNARVIAVAEQARGLTATQIAKKIALPFEEARYDSALFKGSAAELVLTRGNRTFLLSSKRFKAMNTGIEPLKQLVAAGKGAEATGYLYVALGDVSSTARDYAEENDIEIIQAARLAAYFDGKVTIE